MFLFDTNIQTIFLLRWVKAKPLGAILGQVILSNVIQKMKGKGMDSWGP